MTQLEKFIDDLFIALQEKFPSVTIQYQQMTDTHFIKVTPADIYTSEALIDLYFEFDDKFYQSDLEGMLCFITEGALIELDNPSKIHNPIISQTEKVELIGEDIVLTDIFINNKGDILRKIKDYSFLLNTFNTFKNPIDTTKLAA